MKFGAKPIKRCDWEEPYMLVDVGPKLKLG